MALTKCKECGKEVSSSATKCPHCGVSNPAVTAKAMLVGFAAVVALIGGCLTYVTTSGGDDEKKAEDPPRLSDAECMKDLQCWGDRQSISASVRCQEPIEKLAKYSHKWTDGVLEPKMSHFRWANKEKGQVTVIGDKIQFQNGFGAFQNHIYECDYDPTLQAVLAVRARPGRLE